jgi:hypothetical protein
MPYIPPISLATLITEVRALINEPAAGFWTDSEITSWLQQGALDCSTKSGCTETMAGLVLSANVIEYPLPSVFDSPAISIDQFIKVYAAMLNQQALVRIHPRMFGHLAKVATTDPTQYWCQFGQRLFFFPVGSTAPGAVRLFCEVATADPLELPIAWQPLTILYAASRAKLKDQRYAEAAALYTEYISTLVYQRRDLLERPPGSRTELMLPDSVVMTSQAT